MLSSAVPSSSKRYHCIRLVWIVNLVYSRESLSRFLTTLLAHSELDRSDVHGAAFVTLFVLHTPRNDLLDGSDQMRC